MVWVIITVILVVAFGPLLWLMPSPRDRRLSRLRQQAYRRGLRVELRRLPRPDVAPEERVTAGGRTLDVSAEYAAYLMPVERRLRFLPALRLLRHGDGTAAVPGWWFQSGQRPEHDRLEATLAALAGVLQALPEDVLAFETDPLSVAAYWREGPEATPERVDDLVDRLAAAGRALSELETRIEADAKPGNI